MPLLLLPAPRQADRASSALCVLFSYSLLCALVCGLRWQSSVFRSMILLYYFPVISATAAALFCFILAISAKRQPTPQANTTAAGTVAAGQQRLRRACCPLCVLLSYSLLCALLRTRLLLMGMSVGREF